MKTLFIFGGKSTALEIAETAALLHPEAPIFHVMGDQEPLSKKNQFPISKLKARVTDLQGQGHFILSMANPDLRQDCLNAALAAGLEPLTLIHPSAFCSPSARIGSGCYLAPGAVVSTEAAIGDHSILNYNVTVGHHTATGCHCIFNPGAAIGGNVQIGERVLVGSNAFLFQGTTIGEDCQIDALTYIRHDLPSGQVAFGRQTRIFKRAGFQ